MNNKNERPADFNAKMAAEQTKGRSLESILDEIYTQDGVLNKYLVYGFEHVSHRVKQQLMDRGFKLSTVTDIAGIKNLIVEWEVEG